MGCGVCDQQRLRGHKFCSECGARLLESTPDARTERRQLTVLFYDLVDSTELAAQSDPEDFRDAISTFHSLASEAIADLNAFIGAHVGDGGIVYFGYPVAHEDAAECAILAGLRLTRAVRSLTLPNGAQAEARVGIATGTGVVGPVDDGDTGNSAVGQVTSLAARLQTIATAGEVVISDRTRRLVGRLFELDDLGYVDAKGFADGVHSWRVTGHSTVNRFDALHRGLSPLIGRDLEKLQIESIWENAVGEHGGICLVSGEAGVGKSRFVEGFARKAEEGGALRINCFCTPHSQQAAMRPFATHLRRMAGAEDFDDTPSLEELNAAFSPETPAIDRILLAKMIGLSPEETDEIEAMTSNELREATSEAMIRQLALTSRYKPVVFVLEDVHWGDPSTIELLERVVEGKDIGRTLMVLTARPEFVSGWSASSDVKHVRLQPFGHDESCELINQILGGKASRDMVEAISERAGGVPLFIEELTRAIVASDSYTRDHGAEAYELQSGYDLPETLQDSLLARLDQLGPAKRVAQIASVIGREFSVGLVERLEPELAGTVAQACNLLREADLIVPYGTADGQFSFRHVLIQEIAYSTLVKKERRKYNKRLLAYLESNAERGRSVDAERWAHYAYEAGEVTRSAEYWLRAGQEALDAFAMSEADARLRKGLELLPKVDDASHRKHLELHLRLALGKVLLARKGHADPETGETFVRAAKLAAEVGDNRELLAALHGEQAHDLQLSRMKAASERSNEMLRLAEAEDDDVWRLIGYRSRGISSFPLGNYELSASDLQAGLALISKTDPALVREIVVDDLTAAMQIYCSWSMTYLGQYDEARQMSLSACERAETMGQPYTRAFAGIGKTYVKLLEQDFDGIEDHFAETMAICQEHEIWYFLFTARVHLAHVKSMLGETNASADLLAGIEDYKKTGSILYQPTYMHWLALAELAEGKDEAACATNDWSIKTAETYEMHHMLGEYYGLRAVLAQRRGETDASIEAAEKSKRIIAEQKAVLSRKLVRELWAQHEFDLVSSG